MPSRRSFSPTHFASPLSPAHPTPSIAESVSSGESNLIGSMMGSVMGSFSNTSPVFSLERQSDLARLTNTLRAVVEVNERCWRGDECELSNGVCSGLEQVALHTQRASEIAEARVSRKLYVP